MGVALGLLAVVLVRTDQLPANHAGSARICRREPSLNGQLREPPSTFGVPHKSHKCAFRAAPTDIPRTRRHSMAHPGTPAKVEMKTSPEQAKRKGRRLLAVPTGGGQGQDRTVDLPLFSR